MTRPNPIATADLLRSLAECWGELDKSLDRTSGKASRGSTEGKVPLDLDVLDAKRAIDEFAVTYAHMLMDDDPTWTPPAGTPQMLHGLALRVGHFTHHEDPILAHEFAEEVERIHGEAWTVARPTGVGKIPVGPCLEAGCAGIMRVTIDRDKPMDERSLALWQPAAVCSEEREHAMLARLYAEEIKNLVRVE